MAAIREQLELVDKFTTQFTQFISLAERASAGVEDIRDSLLNIETATASAAVGVERLTGEADGLGGGLEKAKSSGEGLERLLRRLIGRAACPP